MAYCRNCGAAIDDTVEFCPSCHTSVRPSPVVVPTTSTNSLAIAGFVCSIVAPLATISLVLCWVALVQLNKRPNEDGKGFAIAGLIISIIRILFTLVFGLLLAFAVASFPAFFPDAFVWSITTF